MLEKEQVRKGKRNIKCMCMHVGACVCVHVCDCVTKSQIVRQFNDIYDRDVERKTESNDTKAK